MDTSEYILQEIKTEPITVNQLDELYSLTKSYEVLFSKMNFTYSSAKKQIKLNTTPTDLQILNDIKEKFCYLFVGHWMQGDLGEDRKNVGLLIKAFFETFKNKKQKPNPRT